MTGRRRGRVVKRIFGLNRASEDGIEDVPAGTLHFLFGVTFAGVSLTCACL